MRPLRKTTIVCCSGILVAAAACATNGAAPEPAGFGSLGMSREEFLEGSGRTVVARRVGRFVTRGSLQGGEVRPFYESSTFDVDTGYSAAIPANYGVVTFDGETRWSTSGVQLALGANWASLGLLLGGAVIEDRDGLGAESDACPYIAVDVAVPWLQAGRWDLGSRARLGIVSGDVSGSSLVNSELSFLHADLDVGLAYAVSSKAEYALSPYAGVGARWIDGVQDFGSSQTIEFDSFAGYAVAGAELQWLPTDALRLSLDAHALLGQMRGFGFSLALSF